LASPAPAADSHTFCALCRAAGALLSAVSSLSSLSSAPWVLRSSSLSASSRSCVSSLTMSSASYVFCFGERVHRLHSRGRKILFLRCCVRPADPALCSAWLKQFQHTTEPSRTLSRIVHSLLNESGLYLHPVRPGRLITEPATSSL